MLTGSLLANRGWSLVAGRWFVAYAGWSPLPRIWLVVDRCWFPSMDEAFGWLALLWDVLGMNWFKKVVGWLAIWCRNAILESMYKAAIVNSKASMEQLRLVTARMCTLRSHLRTYSYPPQVTRQQWLMAYINIFTPPITQHQQIPISSWYRPMNIHYNQQQPCR